MPRQAKQDEQPIPSEAELIDRARALQSALIARSASTDAARCLPVETIGDFHRAGFFNILKPPRHGGYGMSPLSLSKVVMEVGRADMCAAWIVFVLGLHPYGVALMDPRAGEEIWGQNPDALIASSIAPFGQVVQVPGGFEVSGVWRFSSGIDHANWLMLAGMADVAGRPGKDYRLCLVPRSSVTIDQSSWHSMGLCGTGSKDFTVEKSFVPDHMSYSMLDAVAMVGQDKLPKNYRYPFWLVFNAVLSAAIIGGAMGGLDEARRQLLPRVGTRDAKPLAEDPFVRARLGCADVLIRGMVARHEAMFARMAGQIEAGIPLAVDERLAYMAEISQCGTDAVDAMLAIFKTVGARGLALQNRMQAILRNVLSGSNHVAMQLDPALHVLGSSLLGASDIKTVC
jgi:3-hydroxy-9,10-secoandrosta-1,3,5(10)-triene-9,17-dione monooxygenase